MTNVTPNGRPSVRISSNKTYNSGLFILDVKHMPFGCGTWPAYWLVGPNWPSGGEIDVSMPFRHLKGRGLLDDDDDKINGCIAGFNYRSLKESTLNQPIK